MSSSKSKYRLAGGRRGTAQDHHHAADTRSVASLEIEPDTLDDIKGDLFSVVTEEQDRDPHAVGLGGDLKSSVVGIIKAMVGPTILYLPHGFASAGYMIALPIMALATALYLYSSRCLLASWKLESKRYSLEERRVNSSAGGNDDEGAEEEEAFVREDDDDDDDDDESIDDSHQYEAQHDVTFHTSYPELARQAFGVRGEMLVKLGVALMQSGVCLTYLIFVPANLHKSLHSLFGWNCEPELWLGVMLLIQIPLCWIRDVRKFTITNLIANVLIGYGLLVCLGFALSKAVISDENTPGQIPLGHIANLFNHLSSLTPLADHWFLFIGTSVLLFEGSITLLVPLQEAVQKPVDRAIFASMYTKVIISIVSFYLLFGLMCWASFGDDVNVVLTTSLPEGWLATSVQLAYSVAVIFTFPLQNFPALEIATASVAKCLSVRFGTTRLSGIWLNRNFVASILVCLLAVVAFTTLHALDKVVSLMGALCGCPIAFVFPPLIHNRLDKNLTPWRRRLNYLVAGVGIGAMAIASTTTILQWRG